MMRTRIKLHSNHFGISYGSCIFRLSIFFVIPSAISTLFCVYRHSNYARIFVLLLRSLCLSGSKLSVCFRGLSIQSERPPNNREVFQKER
jgi:hypothetical protein